MKDRRRQTVRLVENIPFFSISFIMAGRGIADAFQSGQEPGQGSPAWGGAVAVVEGLLGIYA